MKQARELIEEIKKTKLEIQYGPLGSLDSLYLEIHADASFGNVDDKTRSTAGAVIILRGSLGTGSPIYWRSKVIARVCKSAKSAETCALEDAFPMTVADSPPEPAPEPIQLHDALEREAEGHAKYNLPKHARCAAHTMNLIASADVNKAKSGFNTILNEALETCGTIWSLRFLGVSSRPECSITFMPLN